MSAHLAFFDFIVIKEAQKTIIFFPAVNNRKQIHYFFFVLELFMQAVIVLLYRLWHEKRRKSKRRSAFSKAFKFFTCRFVRSKCKANHLGETVIRIIPFLIVIIEYMFFIPLFLIVNYIGKLIKSDNILF